MRASCVQETKPAESERAACDKRNLENASNCARLTLAGLHYVCIGCIGHPCKFKLTSEATLDLSICNKTVKKTQQDAPVVCQS
jgi:hypothetical protein